MFVFIFFFILFLIFIYYYNYITYKLYIFSPLIFILLNMKIIL